MPMGTVTFLFTDIQGSTRLWQDHGDGMRDALERHDEIVLAEVAAAGGYVFATGGDGFGIGFGSAADAIRCAVAVQQALGTEDWGDGPVLRVRMGMHTGRAQERGGNYFGSDVSTAARVMAVAHGGQIVTSRATAELAPGVPLRDLGEHHLRDIDGSHRLAQVLADGLAVDFAPLRTEAESIVMLPAQRAPLIGREDDVATVRRALSKHRLVTLAGPGGAGKTRLAIEVAAREGAEARDGARFVDLAPVTDVDGIGAALAHACRIEPDGSAPLRDRAVGWLARREVVLVIDNCEHVIDDATDLVDDILDAAPGVRILATSRESLGLDDERTVRVAGLVSTDAGSPAAQLFLERAAAVAPGFNPSGSELVAVVAICDRLDGIPLAIELAAARVRTLDPADIRDRLDDRFSLLTGSRKGGRRRQATLERTIDWSYELLEPEERRFLRSLAVFPSSFGLTAAAAIGVVSETVAIDLLDALVDKSLLTLARTDHGPEFRMLETIREYGTLKLVDTDEVGAARDRHAEYWCDWLIGPTYSTPTLIARLSSARYATIRQRATDFVAMLNWWADQGRLADAFAPVVELTAPLWIGDGRFDEGAEWLLRVAAVVPNDPDLRVRYDSVVCWVAAYRGDPDVLARYGDLLRSAEADGVSVMARLMVGPLVITGIAGLGMDARPYADARVDEARVLAESEPPSELARTVYALALGFRGAARGTERDLEGALADYDAALSIGRPDLANLPLWAGIGQIAYLHLLGRNDEAIARAAEVAGNPEAGSAEWARQLAGVTAIANAAGSGPAEQIRIDSAQRIAAVHGLATQMFVGSALTELGVLAALCDEPDQARELLRHTTGAAVVHAFQLHWEYVARLEQWPDHEFADRRRARIEEWRTPDALAQAADVLDAELTRLLGTASL
jgi:predicted ATPase/class 3 adenylate cyclase